MEAAAVPEILVGESRLALGCGSKLVPSQSSLNTMTAGASSNTHTRALVRTDSLGNKNKMKK